MDIIAEIEVRITVNGYTKKVITEPTRTLLSILRDDLGLLSVKEGCGQGDCGSCIVVMNGLAVNSCLVLAPQAEGKEVLTVEGLAPEGELHPLQSLFVENRALQCGFCAPGLIMSCYALLLHNSDPTPDEIRAAIAGNLCRCNGYRGIIEAVQQASNELGSVLES